jgi:hypothetical protein
LAVRQQQTSSAAHCFKACFAESQGFRDAMFSTLHDVCGLKLPEAAWECLTTTTLL